MSSAAVSDARSGVLDIDRWQTAVNVESAVVGGATSCAWLGCATGSPAPDDRDPLPNPTTLVEDCLDPNRALGMEPNLVAHLGRPVCGWHADQDL